MFLQVILVASKLIRPLSPEPEDTITTNLRAPLNEAAHPMAGTLSKENCHPWLIITTFLIASLPQGLSVREVFNLFLKIPQLDWVRIQWKNLVLNLMILNLEIRNKKIMLKLINLTRIDLWRLKSKNTAILLYRTIRSKIRQEFIGFILICIWETSNYKNRSNGKISRQEKQWVSTSIYWPRDDLCLWDF